MAALRNREQRRELLLVVILILTVIAGCGGADTDQPPSSSGASAGSPTSTATAIVMSADPTATPELIMTPTIPQPPTESSGSSTKGAVADAFRDVQEQVGFELAVPTDLQGLDLVTDAAGSGAAPNPGVSGPPASPIVEATFGAGGGGRPKLVSFMQSAGGLGAFSPEGEVETVTVQGVDAKLERDERDSSGVTFNLRWQVDGVHYHLGGSGLDEKSFLAFAESIRPLSEVP